MDAIARGGRRRPGQQCAAVAAAGLGCRLPQPAGLRSAAIFHRPGAARSRGARDRAGAERLGHPLQPGDDRRPDDARLHGRAHLDRRSPHRCSPPRRSSWAATSCNSTRASATAICWSIAATAMPAPFSADTRTTPPHDLTDKSVLDDYPRGPGSDLLNQLMSDSVGLFADHPVNVRRRSGRQAAGHEHLAVGTGAHAGPAAVCRSVYGCRGAMITAVDLLRGLAALMGWRRIEVPGATGYTDTDYAAKGRYADRGPGRHGSDLRPRRSDRRSIARRAMPPAKIRGPGRDRPAHRRPAVQGARRAGRLSHSDLARPSDAAAHQNPQPRRRAVRDRRHRHRARRGNHLRRSRRRQLAAGLRSGLEVDGIFLRGEGLVAGSNARTCSFKGNHETHHSLIDGGPSSSLAPDPRP